MKKTIFTLAITILMASTILTNCKSPAKKIEDAKDNVDNANAKVDEANQELSQAILDSIQQYRKESEDLIATREKSINEFKVRLANQKIENRNKYEKRLEELEQKNSDLKKRLDDFKADGKENWKNFKIEFTKNMEELGTSIKDFQFKNLK